MSAMDQDFIADCRTLLRARGVVDPLASLRARAQGVLKEPATCYKDNLIEIVGEAAPSLGLLVTKLENGNPVVCAHANVGLPVPAVDLAGLAAHVRGLVSASWPKR